MLFCFVKSVKLGTTHPSETELPHLAFEAASKRGSQVPSASPGQSQSVSGTIVVCGSDCLLPSCTKASTVVQVSLAVSIDR